MTEKGHLNVKKGEMSSTIKYIISANTIKKKSVTLADNQFGTDKLCIPMGRIVMLLRYKKVLD